MGAYMPEETDALFSEATAELQADVRANLADAEEALPETDDVWGTEADNVLGVLNQLQSALTADDASESFTEARKWYLLGSEAGAFDEGEIEEFEARFEALEDVLGSLDELSEEVEDLIPRFPELKGALDAIDDQDPIDDVVESGAGETTEEDESGDEGDVEDEDVEGEISSEGESEEGEEASDEDDEVDAADGDDDDSDGPVESWGGDSDDDSLNQSSFA